LENENMSTANCSGLTGPGKGNHSEKLPMGLFKFYITLYKI
jgi:hypothetical protein